MYNLKFIDKDLFTNAVAVVIEQIKKTQGELHRDNNKNGRDVFTMLFGSMANDKPLEEWNEVLVQIQAQKSWQNSIGEFHQSILGSMHGWENLKTGEVLDIRNDERKIVAEIKNKHNTTKGNYKKMVYDDMLRFVEQNPEFTAYYVEVIPSQGKRYDVEFVPPDNATKEKRPSNSRIRKIDGYSFYELAANEKDALKQVIDALPGIVNELGIKRVLTKSEIELLQQVFSSVYQQG